jgi:hypothetical protein
MWLSTQVESEVAKVEAWSLSRRFMEFDALIAHTEEDALDRGELLTLAAICLVQSRTAGDIGD